MPAPAKPLSFFVVAYTVLQLPLNTWREIGAPMAQSAGLFSVCGFAVACVFVVRHGSAAARGIPESSEKWGMLATQVGAPLLLALTVIIAFTKAFSSQPVSPDGIEMLDRAQALVTGLLWSGAIGLASGRAFGVHVRFGFRGEW